MDRPSEAMSCTADLPRRVATPLTRCRTSVPTVIGARDPARLFQSIVLRVSRVRSIAGILYIESGARFSKDLGLMSGTKKRKKRVKSTEKLVDECVRRVTAPKERETFRRFILSLLDQNVLPLELLATVPVKAPIAGKTRLDQIYDACLYLAFPAYRPNVRERAFGPAAPEKMMYWRALFPKALGLSHIVLRATTYQEAFALACDYACRLSLMEHSVIPTDMTIRIRFMSDKAASRMLDIRHAVRDATRKKSNLKGRMYSPKDIMGARIVALGRRDGKDFSIFRYVEMMDLKRIMRKKAEIRTSAVDVETFRPKEPSPPYDGA